MVNIVHLKIIKSFKYIIKQYNNEDGKKHVKKMGVCSSNAICNSFK